MNTNSKLKQYERAIRDFNKAIQLELEALASYEMREECYQALGYNSKAKADFAKVKQLGGVLKSDNY